MMRDFGWKRVSCGLSQRSGEDAPTVQAFYKSCSKTRTVSSWCFEIVFYVEPNPRGIFESQLNKSL